MKKTARAAYTLEFKQEAVPLLEGGQSIGRRRARWALVELTLFSWVKAKREGKLTGAEGKVMSAEQMEISRLRAELAREDGARHPGKGYGVPQSALNCRMSLHKNSGPVKVKAPARATALQ